MTRTSAVSSMGAHCSPSALAAPTIASALASTAAATAPSEIDSPRRTDSSRARPRRLLNAQKAPQDKYEAPVTSAQEVGWNTKPLVPRNPRFVHGLAQVSPSHTNRSA